jgi:hypothetical protein
MTPRDILGAQFELVVTLEGVTEETGNTIQAQNHRYLRNEQRIHTFVHAGVDLMFSLSLPLKTAL